MSQHRRPARTPKLTPAEQAEAYKRGTPAFRRAALIMFIGIWVVAVAVILLLVFVFHKTVHGGGARVF
jgi:hypothetical protein